MPEDHDALAAFAERLNRLEEQVQHLYHLTLGRPPGRPDLHPEHSALTPRVERLESITGVETDVSLADLVHGQAMRIARLEELEQQQAPTTAQTAHTLRSAAETARLHAEVAEVKNDVAELTADVSDVDDKAAALVAGQERLAVQLDEVGTLVSDVLSRLVGAPPDRPSRSSRTPIAARGRRSGPA